MKARNVIPYISLLFVLVVLTNCSDLFNPAPTTNVSATEDPDKGLVVIHLSAGNAGLRTLLPSAVVFSRYTLNFTREGKEPITLSSADSTVSVELESGSWDLTAQAYITLQGVENLAAQGRKTITVAAGKSINESIAIAADTIGADGIFSYDIRLSVDIESLSKALLVLESLDSGSDYKEEIDLKTAGAQKGTLAVKPGFYLLTVQLENDYQVTGGKTEVVHVYANLETRAEYAFTADDLSRMFIPLSGTAQVITHSAAQKKAGLFVYNDEARSDLIAYAEVNLSNKAWKTIIPDTCVKVYFKLYIEDETGFSFSKTAGEEDIPETGKTGIALNITIPEPHITSFSIGASEAGLDSEVIGTIDEAQSKIVLVTWQWIENIDDSLKALKAVFASTGAVTVGWSEQESGVTGQDFRSDIVYRVTTEDNATKEYMAVFESPQLTGLPVIKIDTKDKQPINSKEEYVYTNIKISDPNNPAYNFEYTNYKDRIRGRGNATWDYPKKPYKIKLDKKTDMLGMGSDKDWVLLANYCDKTLLRTAIAFKLSELLEFDWTPKARFVELFINEGYVGNYQLVEGVKQGSKRVDIPETGYIIEWDHYYLNEPKYFETNSGLGYSFKNPDTDDLTDEQWNYIKDYMNEFEDVLSSESLDDPVNGYQRYIDTEIFAKWYLFQNILANLDTNPYVVKADNTYNTKLLMGPVWDFEWSLGIGWYYGARPQPADYWVYNNYWYFLRLRTDDVFVGELQNLWNQKKGLVRQEILQFIIDTEDEIMKSQAMNFRRWNIMNSLVIVGGIPMGSFEAEVECDRQFFIKHMDWLDTAISQL